LAVEPKIVGSNFFDGVDCLFALLLWGFERQTKKGRRNKMAEADAPVYSAEKATVHLFICFEWRFHLLIQILNITGPRNGSNAPPWRRTINRRNLFGAQFRQP
jgi:hypothetical protein